MGGQIKKLTPFRDRYFTPWWWPSPQNWIFFGQNHLYKDPIWKYVLIFKSLWIIFELASVLIWRWLTLIGWLFKPEMIQTRLLSWGRLVNTGVGFNFNWVLHLFIFLAFLLLLLCYLISTVKSPWNKLPYILLLACESCRGCLVSSLYAPIALLWLDMCDRHLSKVLLGSLTSASVRYTGGQLWSDRTF